MDEWARTLPLYLISSREDTKLLEEFPPGTIIPIPMKTEVTFLGMSTLFPGSDVRSDIDMYLGGTG